MNQGYHQPVLLEESIQALHINPKGTYIDLTFGGGGHSRAILSQLQGGKLLAFDQDQDAAEVAKTIDTASFTFIQANFRFIKRFLRLHGIQQVDGILADLGVSSHQIDTAARGFSTRFDANLDMRMNQEGTLTAAQVLETYSKSQLTDIFKLYGEISNARKVAESIVVTRATKSIHTIDDLKAVLKPFLPRGREYKYLAKVFQALRIVVNDELGALKSMLEQSVDLLTEGGRLVVLSYHSLEDRLVKRFIRNGNWQGEPQKDLYGHLIRPFEPLNNKPAVAKAEEIATNPRARSAKLRVGIRNSTP